MFKWVLITKTYEPYYIRILLDLKGIVIGESIRLKSDNLYYHRYVGIKDEFMPEHIFPFYKFLYKILTPFLTKHISICGENEIIKSRFIKYDFVKKTIPSYLRDEKLENILKPTK